MATLSLIGTLRDGSAPEPPEISALTPQRIDWPRGEDGTIELTVNDAAGEPADLTGCSLRFTVRPRGTSGGTALISREVDIVVAASGTARVAIEAADTVDLAERTSYRYDIWLTDADGKRSQVVPDSVFLVGPAVAEPDDIATVVSTSTPLGRHRGVFTGADPDDLLVGDIWLRSDTFQFCAYFAAATIKRVLMA